MFKCLLYVSFFFSDKPPLQAFPIIPTFYPTTCVSLKYLSGNRLQTNKFPHSLGVKDYICFCLDFLSFLAQFLCLLAFCSEELYQKFSSLAFLTRSKILSEQNRTEQNFYLQLNSGHTQVAYEIKHYMCQK